MPSSLTAMIPVWMMSRIRYILEIYLEGIKLYELVLSIYNHISVDFNKL